MWELNRVNSNTCLCHSSFPDILRVFLRISTFKPLFIIFFCFTISFKWAFYFSCLNIYFDLIHVILILFTFYSALFNNSNNNNNLYFILYCFIYSYSPISPIFIVCACMLFMFSCFSCGVGVKRLCCLYLVKHFVLHSSDEECYLNKVWLIECVALYSVG